MATFKDSQCMQRVGSESHLSRLSAGLNQLRQQATFCDVSIIVGDQRFPAHRAVLSSTSDYFQGMFTSGFKESTENEIIIPGTEESFAQILDFAYTGYFMLSLRTVTNILKIVCYMVFNEAVELCSKYLRCVKDHIAIEDCYEIWAIARNHGNLSDIAQLYRSHLMQSFQKFVKSRTFLENSCADVVIEFLGNEEIETDTMTEEQILQAALIWLKYDLEQRKVHTVNLLKTIRFGLIPHDRLREILGDELLAIPECKDMVEEVVKLSVTKETASPPLAESHPELFATRNTVTAHVDVVQTDMFCAKRMITLECSTDTACYKLTKVPDLPNKLAFMKPEELMAIDQGLNVCITDRGHLYAAGYCEVRFWWLEKASEHRKWVTENNFFRYDSEKNEWILLPPMPVLIFHPIVIPIDDEYIYLISSESDSDKSPVPVMLCYSILSKTWTVEVEDLGFCPTHVIILDENYLLVKGKAMAEGPNLANKVNAGYIVGQVGLYKPDKRSWFHVTCDAYIDPESYFIEEEDIYLVEKGDDKEAEQVKRLICDFDSDNPTMVVANNIEDLPGGTSKALDTMDSIDTEFNMDNTFTFDKRKVGLELIHCECDSHVKK